MRKRTDLGDLSYLRRSSGGGKRGPQLELSVFSSFSFSVVPFASSTGASLVDVAVFGLSSGFSDGSTAVVSLLVLQPMIQLNSRCTPRAVQSTGVQRRSEL